MKQTLSIQILFELVGVACLFLAMLWCVILAFFGRNYLLCVGQKRLLYHDLI